MVNHEWLKKNLCGSKSKNDHCGYLGLYDCIFNCSFPNLNSLWLIHCKCSTVLTCSTIQNNEATALALEQSVFPIPPSSWLPTLQHIVMCQVHVLTHAMHAIDYCPNELSEWLSDTMSCLSSNMIHLFGGCLGGSKLGSTVIASLVSASSSLCCPLRSGIRSRWRWWLLGACRIQWFRWIWQVW